MNRSVVDGVDAQLEFVFVFKLADLIEQDLHGGNQLRAGGDAQSQHVDRPLGGTARRGQHVEMSGFDRVCQSTEQLAQRRGRVR